MWNCLENQSWNLEPRVFFWRLSCLGLGSVSSLVCLVLASYRVSVSRHVSCLMTVSLWGIAKCLFCVETLTFLAESRPLGLVTRCLLTYCKMFVLVVVVVMAIMCLDNCTFTMSQTFQQRLSLVSSQSNPRCLVSCLDSYVLANVAVSNRYVATPSL